MAFTGSATIGLCKEVVREMRAPGARMYIPCDTQDKVTMHGDDACVATARALIVCDGVGSDPESAVFAERFVTALHEETHELTELNYRGKVHLREACEVALKKTMQTQKAGACTMSVVHICVNEYACEDVGDDYEDAGKHLIVANLGDSRVFVVRPVVGDAGAGRLVHESPVQVKEPNMPYQVYGGEGGDAMLEDAHLCKLAVSDGDIVVVGSDGLFDNLLGDPDRVILRCVHELEEDQVCRTVCPQYFAQSLAEALLRQALKAGLKSDDVTVAVAVVGEAVVGDAVVGDDDDDDVVGDDVV